MTLMWRGDTWDYVCRLQERMFPDDLAKQNQVLWAYYADNLPMTYDQETDLSVIRSHLAAEARRKRMNEDK